MITSLNLKLSISLICATLFMTGCVTGGENLVDLGKATVETTDSQRTKVASVKVSQEPDEVIVTGRLIRQKLFAVAGGGHVDVAIVGPDGQVVQETSKMYTPHRITHHQSASFTVRFPGDLPEDSTIRVTHHPGSYSHN